MCSANTELPVSWRNYWASEEMNNKTVFRLDFTDLKYKIINGTVLFTLA
jgi:hypothetical protein